MDNEFKVVHIKTDSVKFPMPPKKLLSLLPSMVNVMVMTFEHETTYDKFCLVNDAVYIAPARCRFTWTAVGSQFQHPYIFKSLFSGEELTFDDFCESKNVIQGNNVFR